MEEFGRKLQPKGLYHEGEGYALSLYVLSCTSVIERTSATKLLLFLLTLITVDKCSHYATLSLLLIIA